MKQNRTVHLIIFALLLVMLTGCNLPQEEAIGADDEIVVLTEDENWELAEPILEKALGQIIMTPQKEPLYEFRRIGPDELQDNLKIKNLIILTRLEVSSRISGMVKSMLPDTTLKRVRNDKSAVYLRENAYAAGQVLLIVPAQDPPDLRKRLSVNSRKIFETFERQFMLRQEAFIYRSGEQFDLAQSYLDQYGWYLRMAHTYIPIQNNPAERFVWWGREFPFRWLSVSWATPSDSMDLESAGRKLMERTYSNLLDDVRINPDFLKVEEVWLKNYAAYRFSGLWEHTTDVKGGPFVGYAFYEPEKDRIYYLNGLVFAPDRRKMPYLRQLEVILQTFDTKAYEP
jgi:hypothetical protein